MDRQTACGYYSSLHCEQCGCAVKPLCACVLTRIAHIITATHTDCIQDPDTSPNRHSPRIPHTCPPPQYVSFPAECDSPWTACFNKPLPTLRSLCALHQQTVCKTAAQVYFRFMVTENFKQLLLYVP